MAATFLYHLYITAASNLYVLIIISLTFFQRLSKLLIFNVFNVYLPSFLAFRPKYFDASPLEESYSSYPLAGKREGENPTRSIDEVLPSSSSRDLASINTHSSISNESVEASSSRLCIRRANYFFFEGSNCARTDLLLREKSARPDLSLFVYKILYKYIKSLFRVLSNSLINMTELIKLQLFVGWM